MSGASKQSHPSPEEFSRFAAGLASLEEIAAIENHLARCPDCCMSLKTVVQDPRDDWQRQQAGNKSLPQPNSGTTMPYVSAAALIDPGQKTLPPCDPPVTGARPSAAPSLDIPPELRDHPRYRVLELLGQGGMGVVYRAEHLLMERTVALKVIGRSLTVRPETVDRFRREVKAAARLSHPNIVQAFDAEQAGDTHFLVMEYVAGIDLARLVASRGPLPVAAACHYVRQAALGLAHAHERGMTHRDVKPHNLMLAENGTVKILDFGLARFASAVGPAPKGGTSEGIILGTVDYIAPEQACDSRTADIRSDIYSLGCTLYHLLTGQPPFPTGNLLDKIVAHAEKEPAPPRQLRADVPEALAAILARMMAKDPARRYQTPAEVADSLAPFAGTVTNVPISTPTSLPSPSDAATAVLSRVSGRRAPRRRWRIAAGLLGVLALGAIAVTIIMRPGTNRGEVEGAGTGTDRRETVSTPDNHDIEVIARANGEIVRVRDKKSGQTWEMDDKKFNLSIAEEGDGLRIELDGQKPFLLQRREGRLVAIAVKSGRPGQVPEKALPGEVRHHAWIDPDSNIPNAVWISAVSPDGRYYLAAGHKPRIRVWDLQEGRQVSEFDPGTGGWTLGAAFLADGKHVLSTLTVVPQKDLYVWHAEMGKLVRKLEGHSEEILGFVLSPDGRRAVSFAKDNTIRIWDPVSGKELHKIDHEVGVFGRLVFSPDSQRFLVCGNSNVVPVWEVETGREVYKLEGHTRRAGAKFSADGRKVVSWADATVRIWDPGTGKELHVLTGPVGEPYLLADGRQLVTVDDENGFVFWDVETGQKGRSLNLPNSSFAFHPDGRRLLTFQEGGPVRVIDLTTAQDIAFLPGKISDRAFSFSPDGHYAVGTSSDRSGVYVFRLPDAP